MSRIGKKPITVPSGVKVDVNGSRVKVQGSKGTQELNVPAPISVGVDGDTVTVTRPDEERRSKAMHGLTRALLQNMIVGVSQGYTKALEIQGVGYNATLKGKSIEVAAGYANKITKQIPQGLDVKVDGGTRVEISGVDKQLVGQFAAEIRSIRKPEPYKGKGIRYAGERVKLKAGKTMGK